MTYSVELFICMVLGLVIGHGIFNTGLLKHFPASNILLMTYVQVLPSGRVSTLAVLPRPLQMKEMTPIMARLP